MANTIARPIHGDVHLRMSYDEYLEMIDDSTHSEWLDGKVTLFMPPDDLHQDIVGFLAALLRIFLRRTGLGVVRAAPFEMKLGAGSYREPDLFVVLREHRSRLARVRLMGPADLVLEVVSRGSERRDRIEKFREYADGGVSEYWIIDPTHNGTSVECYELDGSSRYQAVPTSADGRVHSQVLIGFWIDPRWFDGDELPDELDILKEMVPTAFGSS